MLKKSQKEQIETRLQKEVKKLSHHQETGTPQIFAQYYEMRGIVKDICNQFSAANYTDTPKWLKHDINPVYSGATMVHKMQHEISKDKDTDTIRKDAKIIASIKYDYLPYSWSTFKLASTHSLIKDLNSCIEDVSMSDVSMSVDDI